MSAVDGYTQILSLCSVHISLTLGNFNVKDLPSSKFHLRGRAGGFDVCGTMRAGRGFDVCATMRAGGV